MEHAQSVSVSRCEQGGYCEDVFLNCSLSAANELQVTLHWHGCQGAPDRRLEGKKVAAGCSTLASDGREDPALGQCCFGGLPPRFPEQFDPALYRTHGGDPRRIVNCSRESEATCSYPGPSPAHWRCDDVWPRRDPVPAANKTCTAALHGCGRCEFIQTQKLVISERRWPEWVHQARFCAKGARSYVLASYDDAQCQGARAATEAAQFRLNDRQCEVRGSCSEVEPASHCAGLRDYCPSPRSECHRPCVRCAMGEQRPPCGPCCREAGGGPERLAGRQAWQELVGAERSILA